MLTGFRIARFCQSCESKNRQPASFEVDHSLSRVDSHDQFAWIEWLANVIIGTSSQTFDRVFRSIMRCQQDEVDVSIAVSPPDGPAEFQAVHSRHAPVRDDQLVLILEEAFVGFSPVCGCGYVIPRLSQRESQHLAGDRIVINDQYVHRFPPAGAAAAISSADCLTIGMYFRQRSISSRRSAIAASIPSSDPDRPHCSISEAS